MEKYECTACGYQFTWHSGPTECLMCSSVYVRWLSFNESDSGNMKVRHVKGKGKKSKHRRKRRP